MAQAVSGLMSLTGEADGPPQRAGISVIDVMTGLHTAIAILAALHHRSATGEGQHVESTLLGSALSGMVNQTAAYVAGGVVPFRMGNSHPSLTPYEPLPTADGELVITAGNDRQFRRLCEVIGAPQLADDLRFATTGDRTTHRAQLRPLLAERLKARPSAEWFDLLIAAGVPCGPINTVDAGVQFADRVGLRPVANAGTGPDAVPTIRHPVDFSVTPPRYPLPPPALDEHGDQIRAWLAAPPGPVPWRQQRGTSR
jgi:crotonobetainyl-CoA:carnitine CoA-transferase CaiB-like acyl-CoA transferase